ncbi:MAG TPA: PKD domain-containing protein [Bacillota bacterium]|nr:PKD domain-containing protein [Bacillota bacterium]
MATATNEKGQADDSLEIAAPALENEEPEPEPGTEPEPEAPASASNNAPVITAINFSSEGIITGWTYTVTAECSDPDGDTLTFEWSASGGSISDATVNPMTWQAPKVKGEYSITVTVRDGRGGVATRSQEVSANPITFDPVQIYQLKSITIQPASTGQVDSEGHMAIPSNAGDTDAKRGLQGFITFDLSSIPDSATIRSARLEVVSYDTLGDPFGSLGPLRVYVHNYGTLDAADYTPPPVNGAIVRFSNEAELNNPAVQELNSIGITGIQDALSSDKFQIRLQFNNKETDNDSVTDVLRGQYRLFISYAY